MHEGIGVRGGGFFTLGCSQNHGIKDLRQVLILGSQDLRHKGRMFLKSRNLRSGKDGSIKELCLTVVLARWAQGWRVRVAGWVVRCGGSISLWF